MSALGFCLIAYFIGSINTAVILLNLKKKEDPRDRFSKNAGTTNVYRILGLKWAALVLVLDVGKACLICLAASRYLPAAAVPWVGLFLLLGNRFPCFHGFKGGKGVAHFIGFCLPLSPVACGLALAGWCVAYQLFRLPFAASAVLVGILGTGLAQVAGTGLPGKAGVFLCVGLIAMNHRQNVLDWKRKLRSNVSKRRE